MSKAKRLRDALPTAAPGATGEDLKAKAHLTQSALTTVMWAFLNRGEVLVTEGNGDEPDRFYLNADYRKGKGGGGRKAKAAKKPRKLKRKAKLAAKATPSAQPAAREAVDHPEHYNSHPAAVECIDIVEHFPFNVGNAIKYLWRAGLKGDALADMRKAAWYAQREVERLTAK